MLVQRSLIIFKMYVHIDIAQKILVLEVTGYMYKNVTFK